MNKRCPEKRRYETIITALDALIDSLRSPRRPVVRIYKCSHCLGWHTTSQERRTIQDAYLAASAAQLLGKP